jgi:ComF family protein
LLNQLLELLYPTRCLVCGKPGAVAHDQCKSKFLYVREPFCHRCSLPLTPQRKCGSLLCKMADDERALTGVRSVFWHSGGGRELVLRLKYKGVASLRDFAADEAAAALKRAKLHAQFDFVVAVPLHAARLRTRGYNQAGIVAEALAKRLDVLYRSELLARTRETKSQVELDGKERVQNVKNAFGWSGKSLQGEAILLLDDVCTTGATLNECAGALQRAGAGEIWALTLTREYSAIGVTNPSHR